MKYKFLLYIAIIGLLFSCKPELDEYELTSGSADFSTYVAIGNSLTAGYSNNSLYRSSQMNSFPNILSQQFQKITTGSFTQPLMEGEYGILPGKLKLGYPVDCQGNISLGPVPDVGPLDNVMQPVGYAVHNLGVPGAKSFHILAPHYGDYAGLAVGMANPYFCRFASSPATTILNDAIALDPTFFTAWVGNNDILGYATSGGMGDTITSTPLYGFFLNNILAGLTAGGAKGAIANIPDITSIPFFNTVPPNAYVVTQEQADILNQFLGGFGFHYEAGPNYFIIADANSPIGFRQMVPGELLLLTVPQDSLKCAYWGGFNPVLQLPVPIPGQFVLTLDEIDQIETAVEGYNQTIKNLADQYGLAYVDVNYYLKQAVTGLIYNGETMSSEYVTGNTFSLDGVHLTAKGYALVANLFMEAINAKYGSTLPLVDLTKYLANELP